MGYCVRSQAVILSICKMCLVADLDGHKQSHGAQLDVPISNLNKSKFPRVVLVHT